MNPRRVSDATMRVRDVLYEGLLRRKGHVLTEDVARERANNLATAVLEVLAQMAEESKPPPVRWASKPDEMLRKFATEEAVLAACPEDDVDIDPWTLETRIK